MVATHSRQVSIGQVIAVTLAEDTLLQSMIQLQLIPLPEQVLAAFPYPASQDIEPHELADLSLPPEV